MMADATGSGARACRRGRRLFTAAALSAALAACGGAGQAPEDSIRAWVAQGHEAAEARDRGELVEMISPGYADARGNSRDDLGNLFRLFFFRTNRVALLVGVDEIDVIDETAATVLLTVGMGATTDSALGFDADAYRFELELERDGDDWLLVSGRWGEVGDELR